MTSSRVSRARTLLREHLPFLVLLAVAALLRLAVLLAYRPVLWFYGDSYAYLGVARHPAPYDVRPTGYSFFLEALMPLHRLSAVAAVQHLLGLALGAGVYALLRRLEVGRWTAVAAAAPVLLDAFQLELEQLLMADTLGLALVALALGLLLATDEPSVSTCAWAGATLAVAGLTRTVALVLVVPAVGYLLLRRAGTLRLAGLVALFALPLYLYSGWFAAHQAERARPGEQVPRALTAIDGFFLYGRVMPFADCAGLAVPPPELVLCDPRPPAERPGVEFYIWDRQSPAFRLPGTRREQNQVLRHFALAVLRRQPGDYARAMGVDVRHAVSPFRSALPSPFTYANYRFPLVPLPLPPRVSEDAAYYQAGRGNGQTTPVLPLARALRAYQDVAFVRGPAYLLAALLSLVALLRDRHRDRRWAVCALFFTSGLAVVAVPIVTQGFDYRYQLPALPMLSLSAALGADLLRTARSARPAPAAVPGST